MILLFFPTPPIEDPAPLPYTTVSVWDEFDHPRGEFYFYDAEDTTALAQVKKQKHVDLRSFVQDDIDIPITMLYLDQLGMTTLDTQTVGELEQDILAQSGERWTGATVAKDPLRKNWRILSLACSPGINITQSVFNK